MNDRRLPASLAKAVALSLSLALAAFSSSAPGTSLAHSDPAIQPDASVFATGLLNPRGIAFGPDGLLYVAEAGAGGPDAPAAAARRYAIGRTARVSRVLQDGARETVLDGLPSTTATFDELGATDVAFLDDTLFVLIATGGVELGDPSFDNVLLRVDLTTSPVSATPIFNLTRYNLDNPSLSRQRDPARTNVLGGMPYGLAVLQGVFYATDGNQEHVTRITPDGEVQRVMQHSASDHVLTGITAGPDQALYIAEFGPLPHQEGSARVTRLDPSGWHTTVVRRLVNAIDVAFDAAGQMYVLEFAEPGFRSPRSGRVLRIHGDGSRDVIAASLDFPTSMTFGPDGYLYIASPGHRAPNGEGSILRLRPW